MTKKYGDFFLVSFITLLALVGTVSSAVFDYIDDQKREAAQTQVMLSSLLNERLESINKLAFDYSYWDDTIENTVVLKNSEWADNNIGSYLIDTFGISNSFLLDHNNKLLFKYGENADHRLADLQVTQGFQTALKTTLSEERNKPQAHSFFHFSEGAIIFVSVSALTNEEEQGLRTLNEKSYLVLLKKVDQNALSLIALHYNVSQLSYDNTPDSRLLAIKQPDGADIEKLYFTSSHSFLSTEGQSIIPLIVVILSFAFLLRILHLKSNLTNQLNVKLETANEGLSAFNFQLEKRVKEQTIELRQAKEIAEQGSETKTQLLSTMSHELRTPLNGILGFSQMLHMNKNKSLTALEMSWVAQIIDAGSMLLLTINDALDLARLESGMVKDKPEVFQPIEVFKECHDIVRLLALEKNITLKGEPGGSQFVRVDRNKLQQVLLNLMGNSIKYGNDNGFVRFGCRDFGTEQIELYVEDDGIGIPEKDLAHIFEAFHRSHSVIDKVEGSGVGLSIVKNNIEIMKGDIKVISTEGQGTCFTVYLPAYRP